MEDKKKFVKSDYDNKYIKQKYDRLNFLMPRGTKERISAAAAAKDISSSEYVRKAIEDKLSQDNM